MKSAAWARIFWGAALCVSCGLAPIYLTGCDEPKATCADDQCRGTDDKCYGPCVTGAYCTLSPSGNCSTPVAGVYCCAGSGGGGGGGSCTPTGCAAETPWLCGAHCYADPSQAGANHNCIKCP